MYFLFGNFFISELLFLTAIVLVSLGTMVCLTFWFVRCHSTLTFLVAVWISYTIIILTGGLTIFYALQKEQQHWSRLFISTCQLFGTIIQSAGHDQIEFSYSLWSDPLHLEEIPLAVALPQPDPKYSTRSLDVPRQFQWVRNESVVELHWQPVPDAAQYELARLDLPNSEEGWVSIYQGTATSHIPENPSGWFRVRSLRVTPLDDPVYEQISRILVDTTMTIADIGSVYTMRDYSDDEYVFIVCPAMDANKDGYLDPEIERLAPPGEPYPHATSVRIPPGVREPCVTETPVMDEWGTWFSAVVALYRPDGTREGYVGVDYPVATWKRNIYWTQIFHALFLIIVLAMYFFGIVQITRLHLASTKQWAVEDHLRHTVAELTEAKKVAESASLAKNYFLANMSHEIRTPLNAVLGFAGIIGSRLLVYCPSDQREENQQTINLMERSGSDLLTIINNILDFSNAGVSQIEIEWGSMEPRKIMKDVYNVIVPRLKEKPEILFHLEIDESVPRWVYSAPTPLCQILENICGNAVKFSERGMIRFACQLLTFENTSKQIEEIKKLYGQAVDTARFSTNIPITLLQFIVQDEGIGIPEALQTKLFQPFTQADSSFTRKFGGTGLGLALAKHLTGLMGGDITVQSEENKGTTFCITFAVEVIQQQTNTVAYSGVVLLNDVDKPLSGMNVLVVEDGKINQIIITKMLQDAGATIQIAENGKLGIEAIESSKQEFDVILMDMQMPVMDGYEATFRLRQNGFKKPIIAVTAHALSGDMEKTLQAGCDAYISKPVDKNKLFDMILRHAPDSFSLQ